MTYPVSWVLNWRFFYIFIMILFYFILLFCERNGPDIILYVFFLPRILKGVNGLFGFYVFSLDFSLDWIHFYVSPIIGLVYILKDITGCLGFFLLVRTHRMFYSAIWRRGLVRYFLWIDSTWCMYCQYIFAHNLGTCTSFLDLLAWILCY